VSPANPKIFGVRLTMLLFLYRRRLRAHPMQELLAGAGIAVGVALVFGVLLANSSLTSSASQLVHGLDGSARLTLLARSEAGFPEQLTERVRRLPGVQIASPLLRENVTISGPGGSQAIQLIGVTPSLATLGGLAQQQLGDGAQLLSGGIGVSGEVANTLGAHRGSRLGIVAGGRTSAETAGVVLSGEALKAIAGAPVAIAGLPTAQRVTGRHGYITQLLIEPRTGADALVERELRGIAQGRLNVEPADYELRLLSVAIKPNSQSTTLFSAISVMVGFLLALNAMLLTVPERRRFIAELRMQGYDPRQILLLLGFQAIMLGLIASLAGIALGNVLWHTVFHQVPDYLTVAFPLSAEQSIHPATVLLAVGCGVLATLLASLSPAFDLRPGRPADAVFREVDGRGELIDPLAIRRAALAGVGLIVLVGVMVALAPTLTIIGGVALALATLCLIPAALSGIVGSFPRLTERSRSATVIVAVSELRAITTRSIALAAIAGLAVYGSVAIGGTRNDLLRGIEMATAQYHNTADIWVTAGHDVFNTNAFVTDGIPARIARVPGVRSVRVYQGGLTDIGKRRLWVRARAPSDPSMFESSQLVRGDFSRADALIRGGGWAAVSSGFAEERNLQVGDAFQLPTPSGIVRSRVAAITTNSGWPAGTITISSTDYSRWWRTSEASALEVNLQPGLGGLAGVRAVRGALGPHVSLLVQTSAASATAADASARQGLHTLSQISTLLLIAAALAVAAALSATVWQRRSRLASLKIQGYNQGQLWRGLLLESGVMLGAGSTVGAIVGVYGHTLAAHWLTITTGFPAPFSVGAAQVFLTLALITAIALAVIAVPGLIAARVPPYLSLRE
jgi:putative ABC transport system permease protein